LRLHKRIWHIAETTVEDALAQLSRREAAQLRKLLGHVKSTLIGMAEAPVPELAVRDRDLQAIGFKAKSAVRQVGSQDERVGP
jgi:hypothetical protein